MSKSISVRLGLAALAFTMAGVAHAQLNVYVSTNGKDTWSGLLSTPNTAGTDGPKKTIAGGRDALRSIRAGQSPGGVVSASTVTNAKRTFTGRGAVVNIASGIYDGTTSLTFDSRDSGSTKTPIVYKATTANAVTLDAGKTVTGLAKPALSFWNTETRVSPAVRPQVYVADLSSIGDLGYFQFRFSGWNATWSDISFRQISNYNHAPELIVDGAPMTLAQWPNMSDSDPNGQNGMPRFYHGYTFLTGVGPANDYSNPNSSLWTYEFKADFTGMKTPSTITGADDIWMRGYVQQSRFRETYERVTSLNFANGQANGLLRYDPVTPYYQTNGGRRISMNGEPGRFTIVNSIYELDAPGEYYIDRQNKRLLMVPPTTFVPGSSTVKLTFNNQPVLSANGLKSVAFDGLQVVNSRFMGVYFKNCYGVTFKNGTVENTGHNGITIDDSYRTNVQSCVITDTGEGAIDIQSGDRNTLTVSGNLVSDNVIRRYGRQMKFYTGAVRLDGCGNTVLNNTITDADGEAIIMRGNEQLVQNNTFMRVDGDAGDSGVIVTNHNVADHGNVVKGNVFKEISDLPYSVWGNWALFVDGAGSGVTFEGNVIDGMSHPIGILPACDITIRNNVIMNCDQSAIVAGIGPFNPRGSSYETLANQYPWSGSLWQTKYPHLYQWLSQGLSGPLYYNFSNNVFYNVNVPVAGMPIYQQQLFGTGGTYQYNVKFTSVPFVNMSAGDYTLTTSAQSQVPSFQPVKTSGTGTRTLSDQVGSAP
ncbi:MAG: right-handed parallel beta-helix repeat-containing protein [Armatimonadetes bacterium]|nr:right-handed parallel beta-helix repeat-containing protein [Armatimonadota bacterium]